MNSLGSTRLALSRVLEALASKPDDDTGCSYRRVSLLSSVTPLPCASRCWLRHESGCTPYRLGGHHRGNSANAVMAGTGESVPVAEICRAWRRKQAEGGQACGLRPACAICGTAREFSPVATNIPIACDFRVCLTTGVGIAPNGCLQKSVTTEPPRLTDQAGDRSGSAVVRALFLTGSVGCNHMSRLWELPFPLPILHFSPLSGKGGTVGRFQSHYQGALFDPTQRTI